MFQSGISGLVLILCPVPIYPVGPVLSLCRFPGSNTREAPQFVHRLMGCVQFWGPSGGPGGPGVPVGGLGSQWGPWGPSGGPGVPAGGLGSQRGTYPYFLGIVFRPVWASDKVKTGFEATNPEISASCVDRQVVLSYPSVKFTSYPRWFLVLPGS